MEKEVRLLIATPSCRDWKAMFGASREALIFRLFQNGVNGKPIQFKGATTMGASCLPTARQSAIDTAIQHGFTHIFMVDDDMIFPDDCLDYMFKHNQPIVSVNVCRKMPGEPAGIALDFNGLPIDSRPKTGIEEVFSVGVCAFGLIDLSIFKDIPRPHFEVKWHEDVQRYLGEDLYFCDKLRAHGHKIYIDHDLSKKIYHIGDYGYGF